MISKTYLFVVDRGMKIESFLLHDLRRSEVVIN
jgi:hypothetical protein